MSATPTSLRPSQPRELSDRLDRGPLGRAVPGILVVGAMAIVLLLVRLAGGRSRS